MAEQQLIKEPNDGWPTDDASAVEARPTSGKNILRRKEDIKELPLPQSSNEGVLSEPNDGWPTDDQEERDVAPQVDTQAATAERGDLSVEEDLKLGPPFVYPENRKAAVATPTKKVAPAPAPSPAVQQTAAALSQKEPPVVESKQQQRTVSAPASWQPSPFPSSP